MSPLSCGAACSPCPSGNGAAFCDAGSCGLTCDPGFSKCGGNCVNLRTTPTDCGSCGRTCAAGALCSAGSCVRPCAAAHSFAFVGSFDAGARPTSLVVADFNEDAVPDLAVANDNSLSVWVYLGRGDGGFSTPTSYAAPDSPWALASGDFDME